MKGNFNIKANKKKMAIFFLLFLTSLSLLSDNFVCANQEKKAYIVYMGAIPKNGNKLSLASAQTDLLNSVLENGSPEESLIRGYGRSFNGFVAKLTESEKTKLSGKNSVLSVFPDKIYSTHTTRSWDFLGLYNDSPRNLKLESDVIVGIIDTGIWPEAESFNDKGLGPPPKKWKGACQRGFPCNNKIIGARSYTSGLDDVRSARDTVGHGTHTAATVAGTLVNNASLNHLGEGTARGGVPSARLAIYNVCTSEGCNTSNMLAAFDDAIADGVDMVSISIGYLYPVKYLDDAIAIGSFHAMANGVLTSTSAGNMGPSPGSVTNVAPWLMSVAASSIDRKFTTKVVLGNNEDTVEGISLNPFDTEKQPRPLLRSCDTTGDDQFGKIVYCRTAPEINGAFGQVYVDELLDFARSYDIPTSVVKYNEGDKITEYMNHTRQAVAKIYKSEEAFDSDAPTVVSFSSRGPNQITPDILKPDISAPGVNILAAWSPKNVLTGYEKKYNILSGTSMACPHATAAAAYVKSFHPTWSPAALRSALMTTATPMSSTKNKDAEFAYGSGQINPTKAVNPGLIYETTDGDYVRMLCSEGWTIEQIRLISGDKKSFCPDNGNHKPTVWDLNYPSITYNAQNTPFFNASFPRRVTNVGLSAGSEYKVKITSDNRISIEVSPIVLKFKSVNEELSYTVFVSGNWTTPGEDLQVYSGTILWSDGEHSVRSPVVVYY